MYVFVEEPFAAAAYAPSSSKEKLHERAGV